MKVAKPMRGRMFPDILIFCHDPRTCSSSSITFHPLCSCGSGCLHCVNTVTEPLGHRARRGRMLTPAGMWLMSSSAVHLRCVAEPVFFIAKKRSDAPSSPLMRSR